jgi:hypothetical protein
MIVGVDILHLAYWNFYKNIINKLEVNGHQVYLFIRKRGPLLRVIREEYQKHENIIVTGKYYKGKKKMLLHPLRIFKLLFLLKKLKVDVVTSDGFFIGVAGKLLGIPSVMHSDDFEYSFSYKMTQFFSTVMVIPDVFPITSQKDFPYKGCKEYAYLNKDYFKYSTEKIGSFSDNNKYVFIRLVSKSSLNYRHLNDEKSNIRNILQYLENKGVKVLLSSEIPFNENFINITLLKPPIENFHSILKYSSVVITEGDTMAREAAILGTPVCYIGGRKMKIHDYFKREGAFLESEDSQKIIQYIENCLDKKNNFNASNDFEDINKIMVNKILEFSRA